MSKVTFKEFKVIYNKHVENIVAFCNSEMQTKIAKHNAGWGEPYSFQKYLERSIVRFYIAYTRIPEGTVKCCDVGGFWGIYPLVLKELGYEVVMTEALKFYDSSFDKLFNYIREYGVEIYDIDPFTQDFPKKESYDYISIMAVLEHIPNSLEYFLGNISNALNDTGSLYIEVPNIAYYYKRVNLLKGKSPIPDIEVIYKSESPFIGHHHEYSTNELIRLNKLAGFKVNKLERYNYSIVPSLIYYLSHPIANLCFKLFPNTREILATLSFKLPK